MNTEEIAMAVKQEIGRIAPGIEVEMIDSEGDLREEFDMDSMDFLNLVSALGNRFCIPMPETDYPRMASYSELCQYLQEVAA